MEKDERILIVDGDADFVNELTNCLLAAGYRNIESAENHEDVLTTVKRDHFDVLMMDILAPAMKGLSYAREVKRLNPDTKIFLMIELEHQKMVSEKALSEANLKCVLKPFMKQHLLTSISEL